MDSFVFYKDWYKALISSFDDDFRLKVYDALMRFVFNDIKPDDKQVKLALTLVISTIERDKAKYEDIKQKRSEAGSKHTGNQYTRQNGTNGTNGTNGSVNVNVNDNVM